MEKQGEGSVLYGTNYSKIADENRFIYGQVVPHLNVFHDTYVL